MTVAVVFVCISLAYCDANEKLSEQKKAYVSEKENGKSNKYDIELKGKSGEYKPDYQDIKAYKSENEYAKEKQVGYEIRHKASREQYGYDDSYSNEKPLRKYHDTGNYDNKGYKGENDNYGVRHGSYGDSGSYGENDNYGKHGEHAKRQNYGEQGYEDEKDNYGKIGNYGSYGNQGQAYGEQYIFHGQYLGQCFNDGFYYGDESSFIVCSHGNAYRQPCAPGSRNLDLHSYRYGGNYNYRDFCDVNLVQHGYGRGWDSSSYPAHQYG